MKYLIAATFLLAGGIKPAAIEHTLSIVQRPDGQYDVTCLDGLTEIRSKADVLANRLCTHLRSYNGRWTLIEGGIDNGEGLCNLEISLIRSENAIVKMRAGYLAPCTSPAAETQQCQGLACSLQLGSRFFNFDFSVPGRMTMTRLDDNLTAVFRGNAGSGHEGAGTARLAEMNGVLNILQTTNDSGATWRSVCDDNFTYVEAAVACRELGYSGQQQTLTTTVSVFGDADYGWDDVDCAGEEASLTDCRHSTWGYDDCNDGEHVQLVCDP